MISARAAGLCAFYLLSFSNLANASDEEVFLGAAQKLESIGMLRPSFYWIALETPDKAPKSRKLFDVQGNLVAAITEKFYKQLLMEGTGRLLNKKVINYQDRVKKPDGTTEFFWQICGPSAPFGYGLGNIPLVPFRSVAVDVNVIPIGSKVYIPAAKGAKLPDGTKHDGYFTAVDIGDLIQNKKIDIFTSFGDQSQIFTKIGMQTGKFVEVFVVK